MSVDEMLMKYSTMVNDYINKVLPKQNVPHKIVIDAMRYSLLSGGKRLRPAILLEFYRVLGGDPQDVINFASAVEMIHTYSLIHDDLPCMDNDDMRRGMPSCHIKFGEDIALLAGDALLTLAFETASDAKFDIIKPANAINAVRELAKAAGMNGMVAGQVLDLQSEGNIISLDALNNIHVCKTTAMISVNAKIACILSEASKEQYNAATEFCSLIGLAFQVRDDILDVIGDEKLLGKHVGSDSDNHKNTYPAILGLEKSKQIVDDLTRRAIKSLEIFKEDGNLLCQLANMLALRNA